MSLSKFTLSKWNFGEFRACEEIDAITDSLSIRFHIILMRAGVYCGPCYIVARVSHTNSMPAVYTINNLVA